MSIVDVYAAIAGPLTKALQRGPNGHICEFILIDIPHCRHGKAEAAVGEPVMPTQCECQGEGRILQNERNQQLSPQERCCTQGPLEGILPHWFPLSSRSLRLRKDKGPEPVVRSGGGVFLSLSSGPGACPSIPTHCYISNRGARGPVVSLPHLPASPVSSLNPRLLIGNARVRATPTITVRNKVDQAR